ncbi:MAG: cell division protein FtsZ [bacterium]|nr:cell division protein FtsZ [bacterium]
MIKKQKNFNKKSTMNKDLKDYLAKIKVVGVGGGGGNAISRMRDDLQLKGIDFIAINTDAQELEQCNVKHKIHIGKNLTRGLGTGMNPDMGRQVAEENRSEISEIVKGADLVFITAGLGGGTGSGASPVVAEAAKESGALTIAVVTKPFTFEGSQRNRIATEALVKLKDKVDAIIVIPNDRIFSIIKKETPLMRAFEYVDSVLLDAVQGLSEIIAIPGVINVDFADVKTILKDSGSALVGIGISGGQDRAITAINQAINSPLVEISIDGARGILFGVAGGRDMRMSEINDMAKLISDRIDSSAKVIFGAYYDRKIKQGQLKVTLIAAGFNGGAVSKSSELPSSTLFNQTAIVEERPKDDNKKKEESKKDKINKKDTDIWEIPTFLRKGKK